MPKDLTDVNQWQTVAVPVDSDTADAASVEIPFQIIADRTKHLKDAITVAQVERYFSIDACEMFPGVAPAADPWTSASPNNWYLSDDAQYGLPGPVVLGGLSWQMLFGAGSGPIGSKGLYVPIHAPDGARLISCIVGYHQNGAAATTHYLRMWLLRRNLQGHLIDMIGDNNPPANERSTGLTNNTFTEPFDPGATNIVNNQLYRYYAVLQHFHSGSGAMSPAQEDVYEIRTARVNYYVDEAPGL